MNMTQFCSSVSPAAKHHVALSVLIEPPPVLLSFTRMRTRTHARTHTHDTHARTHTLTHIHMLQLLLLCYSYADAGDNNKVAQKAKQELAYDFQGQTQIGLRLPCSGSDNN